MIMLSSLAVVVGQYSIHSAVEDLLSNQKNEHFTPIMLFYLTRFRYGTCSSLTPSRLARSPHQFYQAIVVNCATAALRHRSAVRNSWPPGEDHHAVETELDNLGTGRGPDAQRPIPALHRPKRRRPQKGAVERRMLPLSEMRLSSLSSCWTRSAYQMFGGGGIWEQTCQCSVPAQ